MKTRNICLVLGIVAVLLLAACGPSAEDIAAMTAAAATDTPVPTETPLPTETPTPTATPIPVDLTLTVTDEEGTPLAQAAVSLHQSGDEEPVLTDESGQASWANLPDEAADLSVDAQGYVAVEESNTLERGPNDLTIALVRDPNEMLPSEACGPAETLLYLEDFQDRLAPEMQEINFAAQGWSLVDDENTPGNVYAAVATTEDAGAAATNNWTPFENAVWRSYFNLGTSGGMSFNWSFSGGFEQDGVEIFDSRYQVVFQASGQAETHRLQQPVTNLTVVRGFGTFTRNWDLMEISTFDGVVTVFLNGQQLMTYTDPQPVPPGGFGFELWYPSSIEVDNISVCGLSAPFETIYAPPADQ